MVPGVGGVTKYDGRSFTHYSTPQGLSDNIVYRILEDKSGNLWFGTRNGDLNKYDGKSFTHYSIGYWRWEVSWKIKAVIFGSAH